MRKSVLLIFIVSLMSSCGTSNRLTRGEQYAGMYEEKPLTFLVMPPINNTANVEAKDLLYTSISRPLIEAGYYVIPPLLSMEVMKAEGAYDSELFVDMPLEMFRDYFGADAVIFSQIDSWTKKGFGIQTKIRYWIKSTITGEILFDRSCDLYLNLYVNSGNNSGIGALISLVASAVATAATDHIVAAREANYYIFRDIPRGKYDSMYMQDKDILAEPKDVTF